MSTISGSNLASLLSANDPSDLAKSKAGLKSHHAHGQGVPPPAPSSTTDSTDSTTSTSATDDVGDSDGSGQYINVTV